MEYRRYNDFIICKTPDDAELDLAQIELIVEATHNTWQPDRPKSEIRANTIQGKKAELVIERLLAENCNARFISYDTIRNDGFGKHAPFDGLIYKNDIDGAFLDEAIRRINADVNASSGDSGTVSIGTRQYLEDLGVYTFEIKSSRLQDPRDYWTMEHKDADARTDKDYYDLCQYIEGFYDYFVYPHYCRDNLNIKTFYEYTVYVREHYIQIHTANKRNFLYGLMKTEFDNCCNIYTRLFFDVISSEIIIPGYIIKSRFFEEPRIMKMKSPKSANAIYYMYHMAYGKDFLGIDNDRELWEWDRKRAYNRLFGAYSPKCPVCGNGLRLVEATQSQDIKQHKFLYVCDVCPQDKKWLEMDKVHKANMTKR